MYTPENRTPPARAGQSDATQQSLFDEQPAFCPQWPNPATLDRRALDVFLTGASLTTPEFQGMTRSWRLAAIAERLRNKLGWPLLALNEDGLPVTGRRTPIARYVMAGYAIEAMKGVQHG